MRFGGVGGLPLLIGSNVAVPGTYTSQFVGTFVQIMTSVTTYPFKGRRSLATLEPGTIQSPQIRVGLHLIGTLSNFDSIIAVAIDFEGNFRRSNTQDSENSGNFGTVIGSGWCFGNMTIAFNAWSIGGGETIRYIVRV